MFFGLDDEDEDGGSSVTRATFFNRLELEKGGVFFNCQRIIYHHSFRCSLETWFEDCDKSVFGWRFVIGQGPKDLIANFKYELLKDALEYVKRRANKPVDKITFDEIKEMSKAISIQSAELHYRVVSPPEKIE